jgi:hypothetical protein
MFFENINWHEDSECSKPKNKEKLTFFFSNNKNEQHQAKLMCGVCPVRKDCIKWALESKQIWGIWGGLDYKKIRRILSVNWDGQEIRLKKFPKCPACQAPTNKLSTKTVKRPSGGRWATMRMVECTHCNFEWQSRTSANAVDAYKAQLVESGLRSERNLKKIKALRLKNKSKKK